MNRRSFLKSIGPALAAVVALPKVLAGDRRKAVGNTNMLNGRRATDTWRSGPPTNDMKRWREAVAKTKPALPHNTDTPVLECNTKGDIVRLNFDPVGLDAEAVSVLITDDRGRVVDRYDVEMRGGQPRIIRP